MRSTTLATLATLVALVVAVVAAVATGCVRERRLGVDLSNFVDTCQTALVGVEVTSVLVQAYELGPGPLQMTAYGAPDCVVIDPPATPGNWETLVEPFLVRGYLVEDLPVRGASRILMTFYAERMVAPGCTSGAEVLCALSESITESLWQSGARTVGSIGMCEGYEPAGMLGFNECIALARAAL